MPFIFWAVNSGDNSLRRPAADPRHWLLDPKIIFLNHGSFGACPRQVLECQSEWRSQIELTSNERYTKPRAAVEAKLTRFLLRGKEKKTIG